MFLKDLCPKSHSNLQLHLDKLLIAETGFKTNSRPNFYGSLFCFYVIIILVTQPPIFELSLVFLSLYILLEILSQKDREDSSQGPAMSELKVLDWEVY